MKTEKANKILRLRADQAFHRGYEAALADDRPREHSPAYMRGYEEGLQKRFAAYLPKKDITCPSCSHTWRT